MGLIKLDKKYKKLYVSGCSFTTGHHKGSAASWGKYLSQKLNCQYEIIGVESASNFSIMSSIINFCETNDMSNACVGVQWSERSRRELWDEQKNDYSTFNVSTLLLNDNNSLSKSLVSIKNDVSFFDQIWFNDEENLYRTVMSIVLLKNYFFANDIDFLMFEGISSILDDVQIKSNKKILNFNYRKKLKNCKTFFSKHPPIQSILENHELFVREENGGHPNIEFVKWWVDEIYEHIENNQ